MSRVLQGIIFLKVTLLLLFVTVIQSDETIVQPEPVHESLRQLHPENDREWSGREAAVAVYPEDTDVAGLALPGSHPIRPRNQQRRRRKRPRPQHLQDESTLTASSTTQNPREIQSYKENSPYLPHEAYEVPEPLENSQINTNPEALLIEDSQLQPQRRRPQQHRIHQDVSNFQQNVGITQHFQREKVVDSFQEESLEQGLHRENWHNRDRQKVIKNEETASSKDDEANNFKSQQHTPNNSYRKPYTPKPHLQEGSAVSPQDLKALLKQQSGSLSLSEILQQKNLSLADLLKGNRNALSALTSEQISSQDQTDNGQESAPPRRLPPSSGSRLKYHNDDNPRPQRYNTKHESEEYTTERVAHRRLPPVNKPSRRLPSLSESRKPIRYREEEISDTETRERINKFVPSSPRRPFSKPPDDSLVSSTESIEVTNSIFSDSEDEDIIHSPSLIQSKKNNNIPAHTTHEDSSFKRKISTTEKNEIWSETPQPLPKNSEEIISKDTKDEDRPQSGPIPLRVQETSNIDPLQNSPESENSPLEQKRLRGKYIPRQRTSEEQNLSSSKEESIKSSRVRLPPPNFYLSALRPRLPPNRLSSTEVTTVKTTELPVQVNSVYNDETTVRTIVPVTKYEKSYVVATEATVKKLQSQDEEQPVVIGKPKVIFSAGYKPHDKNSDKDDEPMHKTIPLHIEPPATKVRTKPSPSTPRDELLEFLKTDAGAIRLARILASRNMTLADLIEHRERGSSQQHLAEIFNQPNIQPKTTSVPFNTTGDEEHEETNQEILNNDVMYNILKTFQQSISSNSDDKNTVIPSIQEMFSFLDEDNQSSESNRNTETSSIHEGRYNDVQHAGVDYQLNSDPRSSSSEPPYQKPQNPTHRPPIVYPYSVPSWKSNEHPVSVYSFEPVNPYTNAGRRPIYTSRLTTTTSNPPYNNEIADDVVFVENVGGVRELGNNGIRVKEYPPREDENRFDILYRNDIEDDIRSTGGLPKDVKSAIVVSSAILGAAILGFLTIFVVCRWRQRQARRRFVNGIVNTRAKSPILMQPEGKNSNRSLSPVMVNSHDLYKRELSIDGDEEHMNPSDRRYYLWRTIRKTLRYK